MADAAIVSERPPTSVPAPATSRGGPTSKRPRRIGRMALKTLSYLVLTAFTLVIVYPLIVVVFNSLKSAGEFFESPWGFPADIVFSNYAYAWNQAQMPRFMLNSLAVSVGTTLLTLAVSATAGYAFAKFRFRGRNPLFVLFAVLLIVPAPVSIIPLYVIVAKLQLLNTYWALILPYAAAGLPLSIYLLRSFFVTIPRELTDAAKLDGCNEFSAFVRVILPLSRPGLATVAIFSFIGAWNEFFLALLFIHDTDMMTLPIGLQTFFYEYHVEWPYYFAGLSMAIMPIAVVYLALQRQFISGMTAGATRA